MEFIFWLIVYHFVSRKMFVFSRMNEHGMLIITVNTNEVEMLSLSNCAIDKRLVLIVLINEVGLFIDKYL